MKAPVKPTIIAGGIVVVVLVAALFVARMNHPEVPSPAGTEGALPASGANSQVLRDGCANECQ